MSASPAELLRDRRVAPSILSADFARLGAQVAEVMAAGARVIHVDVMDGHFVPNITMGPPVVQAVKRVATRPIDVHLMIEDPDRYIEAFVKAGAHMVSVHLEAVRHLHRTLTYIRSLGALAGVVLNPSTPASSLEAIAGDLDFVVVMSVNPGFGGQSYLPAASDKIRRTRALLDRHRSGATLEVDGGITTATIADAWGAGADTFVAGTAVFGSTDPAGAVRDLLRCCAVRV
jgi:ribulose-phosphate 3-epimerase